MRNALNRIKGDASQGAGRYVSKVNCSFAPRPRAYCTPTNLVFCQTEVRIRGRDLILSLKNSGVNCWPEDRLIKIVSFIEKISNGNQTR